MSTKKRMTKPRWELIRSVLLDTGPSGCYPSDKMRLEIVREMDRLRGLVRYGLNLR